MSAKPIDYPPDFARGNATGRRGRSAPALALAALIAVAGCSSTGPRAVGYDARVNVAEEMLARGQFSGAYTILDDVLQDHPNSAPVHLRVAEAYLANRAFNKAEASFRAAIGSGARLEGEVGLGRVALARNDANSAQAIFARLLQQQPGNLASLNGLGVSYDLTGHHETARQYYLEVLQVEPNNTMALNNLALSHTLSGNATYAAQVLRDLTESQLDDPVLRQNYALALYASGRSEDAMRLATVDMGESEANVMLEAVRMYRGS